MKALLAILAQLLPGVGVVGKVWPLVSWSVSMARRLAEAIGIRAIASLAVGYSIAMASPGWMYSLCHGAAPPILLFSSFVLVYELRRNFVANFKGES